MAKLKFITDHQQAAESLFRDVGKNNVVCYDIPNFPYSEFASIYPTSYLDKCTSVTVATSGDACGRDWMVMLPYRVDHSGWAGDKVYDIDPFVVTFDSNTGLPSQTGILAYHQNFQDRTSPISGYQHLTKPQAVVDLRQQLVTGCYPISGAAPPVSTALGHMVQVFQSQLD